MHLQLYDVWEGTAGTAASCPEEVHAPDFETAAENYVEGLEDCEIHNITLQVRDVDTNETETVIVYVDWDPTFTGRIIEEES